MTELPDAEPRKQGLKTLGDKIKKGVGSIVSRDHEFEFYCSHSIDRHSDKSDAGQFGGLSAQVEIQVPAEVDLSSVSQPTCSSKAVC